MIEIFKLFFGYFIIFGVRESDAALKNGAASNISFTDDAVIIEGVIEYSKIIFKIKILQMISMAINLY